MRRAMGSSAPREEKLLLIGVTHRDPREPRRVLGLLRRARPSRILVELSRASLEYRLGPGRARAARIRDLLERTDPATPRAREAQELLAVLALPGELRAALKYAGESGARVHLADLSRHAIPKLREIDAWACEVAGRLERAEDPVAWTPPRAGALPRSAEELAEIAERERYARRAIRRALRAQDPARVAYIGGFGHVRSLTAAFAESA